MSGQPTAIEFAALTTARFRRARTPRIVHDFFLGAVVFEPRRRANKVNRTPPVQGGLPKESAVQ
eukprot:5500244-Lingulodinium_polyedra.AAC.1